MIDASNLVKKSAACSGDGEREIGNIWNISLNPSLFTYYKS